MPPASSVSVLSYPTATRERKHAPSGYRDCTSYKDWLRDEFDFACAYCLQRERWSADGAAAFAVEHIIPRGLRPDLECVYSNLVYACLTCNSQKRDTLLEFATPQGPLLLDPCTVPFGQHLRIRQDGIVEPATHDDLVAAKLLEVFRLNSLDRVRWRRQMILVALRHRIHPDNPDAVHDFHFYYDYPDDLPKLADLRPPGGNSRPEGMTTCFWQQRQEGTLSESY